MGSLQQKFFANVFIFIIFFYEYKSTAVNKKKTKKDMHQASKHLRMPRTNLKTIKFNKI